MSAPFGCWRPGAWRAGSWRTGSWRGFGSGAIDVAFFEYKRHRGWNRRRETLRLGQERNLERSIRQIYRAVTGSPETAARAAEIVSPFLAQAEGLMAQRLELERMTAEAEIALHMLFDELQAVNDQRDEAAIMALLPKVL